MLTMLSDKAGHLTLSERVGAVKFFYQTNNQTEAVRRLKKDFGIATRRQTVADIVSKFESTGCVIDIQRSGRPRTSRNDDNQELLINRVSENPRTSTRRLSLELQLSRSSVQRLLRDSGLKPYRPHLVQGLSEDDFDRRVECCEELLQLKPDGIEF